MPVPTQISDLSTTAASNSPPASDGAGNGDDYLRAVQALFRASVGAGSDVASASTITPATDANSSNLTGTTTVTAISSTGSWDGRIVFFRHTGAHQFTHSSTLVCLGGASITFASGDISAWRQRTSGTWDQVLMHRADGAFLGDSWNVDTSGRLLNNGNTQPSVFATITSDVSSGTTVIWNNEITDQGSVYNNSTGVFTVPSGCGGWWSFNFGVKFNNTSGGALTCNLSAVCSTAGTFSVAGVSQVPSGSAPFIACPFRVRLVAGETVSFTSSLSFVAGRVIDAGFISVMFEG